MSTIRFNNVGAIGGGTETNALSGLAKAWCVYTNSGTPTSVIALNVSSLTDNAAGDVTSVFTTAFSTANYIPIGSAINDSGDGTGKIVTTEFGGRLAASHRHLMQVDTGTKTDRGVHVIYHGTLA